MPSHKTINTKDGRQDMIPVIKHNRDMRITNLDQLAHGTGAKYLEVLESHIPDTYIAVQWRRKNTVCNDGHILIELS